MVAGKKGSKKDTKIKKIKKVPEGKGIIHGTFSFNNTKLDLSKENGDVLKIVTAGSVELGNNKKVTGTKKGTVFMAEKVAEEIIKKAADFGIHNITELRVRKIGAGRDSVIKRILAEKSLNVGALVDVTPIPHGERIVLKDKPHSSSFIFHHLPEGMGIVLGNYLRQFLMKYTGGIAPAGAEIIDKDGPVRVEESILSGVAETTPYLIINLKKIIVEAKKKDKEGIFRLELNVENKENKERVIKASDFQKDKEVEIKNPELYLATLAPSSSLKIKLYFQKNWGYHEEDEQKETYFAEDENIIPFDTDYSPVKGDGVNFQIKLKKVSKEKKEEELTLAITTSGTVEPENALREVLELSKTDVILHEKVETSLPMARSLTKLLAKLVKFAKQDTLHSRRLALQYLVNKKKLQDQAGKKLLDKLFSDLKEKYKNRAGGYSRITKLNYRIELEEIRSKINKLEVEESKDANWQTLKKDVERRIELVKENQLLVNKFLTQLSKVEGKITQLEARIALFRDKEESGKLSRYFFIAIVIILLVFFLYLIATGKILSESKTAHFKHKYGLKGDSKNCFYEVKEESKKPTSKPNNNSTKSENKGDTGSTAVQIISLNAQIKKIVEHGNRNRKINRDEKRKKESWKDVPAKRALLKKIAKKK
ncbi:6535_t:CDS:2, partial [Funneliformis geosporum]